MRALAIVLWIMLALAACDDDAAPPMPDAQPDAATATLPHNPPPSCPISACHPDAHP